MAYFKPHARMLSVQTEMLDAQRPAALMVSPQNFKLQQRLYNHTTPSFNYHAAKPLAVTSLVPRRSLVLA